MKESIKIKRWKRYKHPYKGDVWSKLSLIEFEAIYGNGWQFMDTTSKWSDIKSVILEYWDQPDRTKVFSEITKLITIRYANKIPLFEEFYKLNNSLRYCNGSYFKFQDKTIEQEYNNWLKSDDYKKKSFDLFYGSNGVVD